MLNDKVAWIRASASVCIYMRSVRLHSFRSGNRASLISSSCQFLHITRLPQDVTTRSCAGGDGSVGLSPLLGETSCKEQMCTSNLQARMQQRTSSGFPTAWISQAHGIYLPRILIYLVFTMFIPYLFMLLSKTTPYLSGAARALWPHVFGAGCLFGNSGLPLQSDVCNVVVSPDDHRGRWKQNSGRQLYKTST